MATCDIAYKVTYNFACYKFWMLQYLKHEVVFNDLYNFSVQTCTRKSFFTKLDCDIMMT